jgi:hypothetical protein
MQEDSSLGSGLQQQLLALVPAGSCGSRLVSYRAGQLHSTTIVMQALAGPEPRCRAPRGLQLLVSKSEC